MLLGLFNTLKAAEDILSSARTGVHTNNKCKYTNIQMHLLEYMYHDDDDDICMHCVSVRTMHSMHNIIISVCVCVCIYVCMYVNTNHSQYGQQICMHVYKHEPFAVWTVKGQQEIVAPRSTSTSEIIMVSSLCQSHGCLGYRASSVPSHVHKDSLCT
jgi:hypothetical protein